MDVQWIQRAEVAAVRRSQTDRTRAHLGRAPACLPPLPLLQQCPFPRDGPHRPSRRRNWNENTSPDPSRIQKETKCRVWLPEQSALWYTGHSGVWVCLWCVLSQPGRENSGKTEVRRAGAEAGVWWGSSVCHDLSKAGRKQMPWRGTAPRGAHVTSGRAPLLAARICRWPTPRLQSAPLSSERAGEM